MGADLTPTTLTRARVESRKDAETRRGRALIATAGLIRRDAQDLAAMLGVDTTLGLRLCGCARLFRPVAGRTTCQREDCAGTPGDGCEGCGQPFSRTRHRLRFCSPACALPSSGREVSDR